MFGHGSRRGVYFLLCFNCKQWLCKSQHTMGAPHSLHLSTTENMPYRTQLPVKESKHTLTDTHQHHPFTAYDHHPLTPFPHCTAKECPSPHNTAEKECKAENVRALVREAFHWSPQHTARVAPHQPHHTRGTASPHRKVRAHREVNTMLACIIVQMLACVVVQT